MEVSGAVVRQASYSFRLDSGDRSTFRSFSGHRNYAPFCVARTQRGVKNYMFFEKGHLQYYDGPCCGGKSMEEKQKKKQKDKLKRELKLLQGFSGDLSASSQMGLFFPSDNEGKLVSERAEELVRQLQQLKAEQKELKRKRKLEKAKLKPTKTIVDSSSSSSESSDNEARDVINMRHHRTKSALLNPSLNGLQTETVQGSTLTLPPPRLQEPDPAEQSLNLPVNWVEHNSVSQLDHVPPLRADPPQQSLTSLLELRSNECCPRVAQNSPGGQESGWRVEVCMGNKCRKAGAAMVLEEFERVVGVEGAVCGCKCMGKCRDGPNVRVLRSMDSSTYPGGTVDSAKSLAGPLCIGVGLEDVGRIAADFLGPVQEDHNLAPAT